MREHLRVYEGRHLKFVGLCGGGGNTGPARSRASGQRDYLLTVSTATADWEIGIQYTCCGAVDSIKVCTKGFPDSREIVSFRAGDT